MMRYLCAEATAYYGSQHNNGGESAVVTLTVNALRPTIYGPRQIVAVILNSTLCGIKKTKDPVFDT
jgi:hypothetical protein